MNKVGVQSVYANERLAAKYDVNVLALFHCSGKYRDRVGWFKRLGLVNLLGMTVHVMAVCSIGDGPHLQEVAAGWAPGVHVTALETMSDRPIPKINAAYLWLRESNIQSRWFLRVDDDSVTDIGSLLEQQERRFGDVPIHLMCSPNPLHSSDHATREIQRYFRRQNVNFTDSSNEYEASLTSGAALERVFCDRRACKFLYEFARYHDGPGDKCLTFAARVANVPVATAIGMHHKFVQDDFSLSGGKFTHIHYVDWSNAKFREMLEDFAHGTWHPARGVLGTLQGRSLEFGRCIGMPLAAMRLNPDHSLGGSTHHNEFRWTFVGDSLWFIDTAGNPSTEFSRLLEGPNHRWLIGSHLTENRAHYLGPI